MALSPSLSWLELSAVASGVLQGDKHCVRPSLHVQGVSAAPGEGDWQQAGGSRGGCLTVPIMTRDVQSGRLRSAGNRANKAWQANMF